MMHAEATRIIKNIRPQLGAHTFLLGVDGMGTAGKTTLAMALEAQLRAQEYTVTVLHIDDFIHPRALRYTDAFAPWECYYNVQWRYDYLIAQILDPIKRGEALTGSVELYDKPNDSYLLQPISVSVGSILILEGIFLQRPELKDFFDYMVYIHVPEARRLARARVRDGYIGDTAAIDTHYLNRYFPAERHYLQACRPIETADYVIYNE